MRKKSRGNGSGSISFFKDGRKKSYIVFAPAVYTIGEDGKVKKTQKRLGSFATRSEAEKCLTLFNMSVEEKINYYKGVKILNEVYNEYVSHIKQQDPNRSLYNIEKSWKKIDSIKEYKISNIEFKLLQNTIDSFTPHTGRQVKSLLNNLYKFAIKNGYVDKNFAELIETKKANKIRHRLVFDREEIEYFNSCLYSDLKSFRKFGRFLLTLLYTGMRVNELITMKVSDIHLNENYMIGGSKTESGKNRIIPIHSKIKQIIEYYINTTPDECLIGGDFKTRSISSITGAVNTFLEEMPRHHSTHDCRATFLTQAYIQKLDWVIIEKAAGHATNNIGLDFYVKITKEDIITEVNKLDYSVVANGSNK